MNQNYYRKIYEQEKENLYRYLLARSPNKEIAEDILQDTFEKLGKELKKQPTIEYPKAWLFTVARNRLYRVTSRNQKYVNIEPNFYKNNSDTDQTRHASQDNLDTLALNDLGSEQSDITTELMSNELQRQAVDLLRAQPAETQDIIILKLWEDMKFNQISKQLNLKLSTVKQRYYRGLNSIRDSFSKVNSDSQIEVETNNQHMKITRFSLGGIVAILTQSKDLPEFNINLSNLISTKIMTNTGDRANIASENGANVFNKTIVYITSLAIIATTSVAGVVGFGFWSGWDFGLASDANSTSQQQDLNDSPDTNTDSADNIFTSPTDPITDRVEEESEQSSAQNCVIEFESLRVDTNCNWTATKLSDSEEFPLTDTVFANINLDNGDQVIQLQNNSGLSVFIDIRANAGAEYGSLFTSTQEFEDFAEDKFMVTLPSLDTQLYISENYNSQSGLANAFNIGPAELYSVFEFEENVNGSQFNGFNAIIEQDNLNYTFYITGESADVLNTEQQDTLMTLFKNMSF